MTVLIRRSTGPVGSTGARGAAWRPGAAGRADTALPV
jgi:hypothetical protein